MVGVRGVTGATTTVPTIGSSKSAAANNGDVEVKPHNILIKKGEDLIEGLLQASIVEGGRLRFQTEHGPVELQVCAVPQQLTSSFWRQIGQRINLLDKPESIPPVPLAVNSRIGGDVFAKGEHTQLMGVYPYVVMEDDTKYGVKVTVPTEFIGQWENFQGPPDGDFLGKLGKIEVGRRRTSLAFVVRTDDGNPLLREQKQSSTVGVINNEMLAGLHTEESGQRASRLISERVTVTKHSPLSIGEEKRQASVQQDLIFTIPPKDQIKGDLEDKKGLVEVVVFQVVEKKISEIIEKPQTQILRGAFDDSPLTLGGGTRGFGFQAGETTFGKEKREPVNISGVRVEKPIAAFRLVLVGENSQDGLVMAEQTAS